ncbi:MAG TPA: lytic murein transglycosylase B [Nevskiales bacterium]|nr:lytic murein transglycosylase B [Nevskiales bacterium]
MRVFIALFLSVLALDSGAARASYADHDHAADFIQHMVSRHGFAVEEVRRILNEAEPQERVLEAMKRPAEKALPWYKYRRIFITNDRIDRGAEFLQQHQAILQAAEQKYGVPAEIIVAIIGVETWYGRNIGSFRVLDALATLAFDYPRRADFFRSELEQYLLMCREEKVDPTGPLGSYAGAMGLPQFMPSSFRHYAVDFNGNGRRDLWNEPADVIGSVANYLASRGWRRGEPVAAQVRGDTDAAEDFEFSRLEPLNRFGEIASAGVRTDIKAAPDAPAGILELEGDDDDEYWVALKNFFVITTYNRSPLYAMAVFQLGQAVKAKLIAG